MTKGRGSAAPEESQMLSAAALPLPLTFGPPGSGGLRALVRGRAGVLTADRDDKFVFNGLLEQMLLDFVAT